jgi:hypothetical protein
MVGEQADSHCPGRTLRPWSRQAETAHLADIHDDVATARLTNWDPSGHLPHSLYCVLKLVGHGQHAGAPLSRDERQSPAHQDSAGVAHEDRHRAPPGARQG